MDAIGESVENVGLAQEIQKGLAKSLQRPPKFAEWQADIDAKKAELSAMEGWDCYSKHRMVKNCVIAWAKAGNVDLSLARRRSSAGQAGDGDKPPTEGGVKANWDDFKASSAMDICCKYIVAADKVYAEPVSPKQFEEMRALGKGAFGAVFLTFKKDTGAPFAVKKCVKTIAKENKMIKDVLIEREVLSKMRSPFCVCLNYAFQDKDVIYLVLTLCPGGDLGFLLQKQWSDAKKKEDRVFKPFPDGAVKFYAASMALGLQAIHDAGYVYRDLKPQNVLLDSDGLVRISDMGLTADVSGGPIKQCSGTRGYWSPETINKEKYTFEPDWWSLGVTMYVLFSDKLPFKGKSDEEKDASTVAGEIEYSHGEPDDLQKVISALCNKDMKARLGCSDGKGLVGVADLKAHDYFKGFDWGRLELGTLPAPVEVNANDINAPGKNEIAKFVPPKGVSWTDEDQAAFASWDYMDKELWYDEAMFRIRKYNEIGGGGGGGGCCTIA